MFSNRWYISKGLILLLYWFLTWRSLRKISEFESISNKKETRHVAHWQEKKWISATASHLICPRPLCLPLFFYCVKKQSYLCSFNVVHSAVSRLHGNVRRKVSRYVPNVQVCTMIIKKTSILKHFMPYHRHQYRIEWMKAYLKHDNQKSWDCEIIL